MRSSPDEAEDGRIIKAHCNNCGGERNHFVLHREQTKWDEDIGTGQWIWGSDDYLMIKCAGCENVHLRHESFFSESGIEEPDVRYYPPATSRRRPDWLTSPHFLVLGGARHDIRVLLHEIYTALQNGAARLPLMGIRAILDMVMVDKVGDRGTMRATIQAFFDEGYVPAKSQEMFQEVMVEAGHAAIHRRYAAKREALEMLMDLTESIVASVYVHPSIANALKADIPRRK